MPPTQRKPAGASSSPAASAKAAARSRSARKQSLTLREVLPLLVLLALLGLGGAAYFAHSQGWFAAKARSRPTAGSAARTASAPSTGSAGQDMADSVRKTLKEEGVGLEQTQPVRAARGSVRPTCCALSHS